MSWDISLENDRGPVVVDRHAEGGTYPLGGTTRAELNVTYNYADLFPFRELDGQRAGDTRERMREAIAVLGTQRDQDYWTPTPGNVGHALEILLAWADQYPEATWRVV